MNGVLVKLIPLIIDELPIVIAAIQTIRSQTNATYEEILAHAELTNDLVIAKLLADKELGK
jgi:hypothetical protein